MSSSGNDIENPSKSNPNWRNERRREIRLRRSDLMSNKAEGMVTYKIATEREEIERSFELVWDSYVKVGLQPPDSEPIRFTKYHLLPTTKIFIAIHRPELLEEKPDYERLKQPGEIVGTLTLVPDSLIGLPMEEVCSCEVTRLRQIGSKAAEVVALAVKPEFRRLNVMMYLYQLMFEYAKLTQVSDLTCSVTKRHISFYRSTLLFQPMSDLRAYSAANGLDVQCHRLNLDRFHKTLLQEHLAKMFDADLYTFFFTANPEVGRQMGMGEPWNEEMLRYFLAERTRFIEKLDAKTLKVLRQLYAQRNKNFPF